MLTFRALLELLQFGDRSHQLAADSSRTLYQAGNPQDTLIFLFFQEFADDGLYHRRLLLEFFLTGLLPELFSAGGVLLLP